MKTIFCILLAGALLSRAETIPSALKVGDSIPDVTLRTVEDKEVSLRKLVSDKPAVLVFYRGGWCPFCNAHLQALTSITNDLTKEGMQLIAISMDQPSKLRETMQKDKLDYTLLSDSDAKAVKAFGISYKVDDATLETTENSQRGSGCRHGQQQPYPSCIRQFLSSTLRVSSASSTLILISRCALNRPKSSKRRRRPRNSTLLI